jgi:two-component system, NtrC family, nitrogen regulation sensor histidine kinase NtrY
MAYSFRIVIHVALLATILTALIWMTANTHWHVTILLCAALLALELGTLLHVANKPQRDMAYFLEAVLAGDFSQTTSTRQTNTARGDLAHTMTRVLDHLRHDSVKREAQAHYLHAVMTHIPVSVMTVDECGEVELLSAAARHLFEHPVSHVNGFARYGVAFAATIGSLQAGCAELVRMERSSGPLTLKAAAAAFTIGGAQKRLISLQNVETELSAQELSAWQTVIRVMTHEVMNSLTPISSLANTALALVQQLQSEAQHLPAHPLLAELLEALETVARRSTGLLRYIEGQRPLTKRLVANPKPLSVQRIFARLQRLLAADLQAREINFTIHIDPETLQVPADSELLDQALINLVRNAIEALASRPGARISLRCLRDRDGRIVISVADNGPGIAPELREKIFVPFFTTKRGGSGVGLALVRQIAVAHNALIQISETPGGGATVALRF